MRKSVVLSVLVGILVLATATTVFAGFTWCMTDPNIQLPDGGVVHVWVGVPREYRDTGFTLDVWAPAGSELVGSSGAVNVTVVLHESNKTDQIKAKVAAGFPVLLSAKYQNVELGEYVFEKGRGTATWSW